MNRINSDTTNRPQKKKRFRIIPFIISLLVSFVLWNYVMMVESPTRQVSFDSIPITINKGDNSLAVISGASTTVNITVNGKKSITNTLTKESFRISADISDIAKYSSAGEYKNIPLKIELPEDITLVSQSAQTVTLYLDNKEVKTFPVTVEFTGSRTLDSGCELGVDNIEFTSKEVNVTGPSSVLSLVDKVALRIPLDGNIESSQTFSGTPVLVDKDGTEIINTYLSMDVTSISGRVPVYMTKDVPLTVLFKNGFFNEENTVVSIEPATVTIRGEIENVKKYDSLPLTTVDEKKFTSPFTVSLPELEDVTVMSTIHTFNVTIDSDAFAEKTVLIENIGVSNPNELNYALANESVSITLMGEKSAIEKITSADVSVTAEMGSISDISASAQSVPLTVKIADAYSSSVWEKGEYTVTVSKNQ